jgi:hypothetical protein
LAAKIDQMARQLASGVSPADLRRVADDLMARDDELGAQLSGIASAPPAPGAFEELLASRVECLSAQVASLAATPTPRIAPVPDDACAEISALSHRVDQLCVQVERLTAMVHDARGTILDGDAVAFVVERELERRMKPFIDEAWSAVSLVAAAQLNAGRRNGAATDGAEATSNGRANGAGHGADRRPPADQAARERA